MTHYKLHGTKNQGQRVDRAILEGSTSDPKVFLDMNGEAVELSDEQVAELRSQGLDVRKVSESQQQSEGDNEGGEAAPEEQRKAGEQAPASGETTSGQAAQTAKKS